MASDLADLVDRLSRHATEVCELLDRLSSPHRGAPIRSQERRRMSADAQRAIAALTGACDELRLHPVDATPIAESRPVAADGREPLEDLVAGRDALEAARADLQRAVDRARTGGASWRRIGAALGVAGQTAHKRFDPAARRRHAERMRQRARRSGAD